MTLEYVDSGYYQFSLFCSMHFAVANSPLHIAISYGGNPPHDWPHKLGAGFFLVCSNFQRYDIYSLNGLASLCPWIRIRVNETGEVLT